MRPILRYARLLKYQDVSYVYVQVCLNVEPFHTATEGVRDSIRVGTKLAH